MTAFSLWCSTLPTCLSASYAESYCFKSAIIISLAYTALCISAHLGSASGLGW